MDIDKNSWLNEPSIQLLKKILSENERENFLFFAKDEKSKKKLYEGLLGISDGTALIRVRECAEIALSEITLPDQMVDVICKQLTFSYPALLLNLIDTKSDIITKSERGLRVIKKALIDHPEAAAWINEKIKEILKGGSYTIESIVSESILSIDYTKNHKSHIAEASGFITSGRPKDTRASLTLALWEAIKPGHVAMRKAARCMAKFLVLVGLEEDEDTLSDTLYQTIRNHENA